MEVLTLDLPTMFGDHHVLAVRQLLFALPGVVDVYASSLFQLVEIQFDPAQVSAARIRAALEEAAYLNPMAVPVEHDGSDGQGTCFRHTSAQALAGKGVPFAQEVAYRGPALWPCPGLGVLPGAEEGKDG